MNELVRQRCANHLEREAAARCNRCRGFFCRECVSEHDDSLLCARCLKEIVFGGRTSTRRRGGMVAYLGATAGFLLAWLLFYSAGKVLLTIDSSVHDGTIWKLDEGGAD